jgi:NDP-sugar pyrophosphorylase family protein
MDAIVLCGGKGTRLASVVSDVPKPLAPIGGRPFLDYLLAYLERSGLVSRVVLATGYLAQQIEDHYGAKFGSLSIVYSYEAAPLGTGGALLLALRSYSISSPFLVLNGDSFIDVDLASLVELLKNSGAGFAMSLHQVDNAARFGTVELFGNSVIGFSEKTMRSSCGLINAGVYLLTPETLNKWYESTCSVSLELDILPDLVSKGNVVGFKSGTHFIDIGLPETYFEAPAFFQDKIQPVYTTRTSL